MKAMSSYECAESVILRGRSISSTFWLRSIPSGLQAGFEGPFLASHQHLRQLPLTMIGRRSLRRSPNIRASEQFTQHKNRRSVAEICVASRLLFPMMRRPEKQIKMQGNTVRFFFSHRSRRVFSIFSIFFLFSRFPTTSLKHRRSKKKKRVP